MNQSNFAGASCEAGKVLGKRGSNFKRAFICFVVIVSPNRHNTHYAGGGVGGTAFFTYPTLAGLRMRSLSRKPVLMTVEMWPWS